ncbi:hypothetical protein [Pseudomonas sp. Ant30-3]|uniref:hypothetical protein n=1 Tax=Pseudomonas sp. Ant30-3 TaxID=1488328 RepID=UPI00049203DA|nr:hypothetical protein [Pseudomonas sp. Ant30-3]
MRLFKVLLFQLMTSLLLGCTATPYDKATVYYDRSTFGSQIVNDLPQVNAPLLQHGRCSVLVATPGSNVGEHYLCTYALTADELYVQGWNAGELKYEKIMAIRLSALRKISLYSSWRNSQLHLTEERRQVAFSVVIDEGGQIDAAATARLFDFIREKGIPVVENVGPMKAARTAAAAFVVPIVVPR